MDLKWDSENLLVSNMGNNPLVGYNFMLRVEGIYDLPCKSVKAFTKENEYEYIQEGGLNDYVHMRRKPVSKPFIFEVERYVGTDYMEVLPNGAELLLPVVLFVSRYPNEFNPLLVKRNYVFTGCTVISKNYGELNAAKSDLLVETTTIAYRELLCVDVPLFDFAPNTWTPDNTTVRGVNGKATIRQDQTMPDEKLWKPKIDTIKGEGTRRAENDKEKGQKKPVEKSWKADIHTLKGKANTRSTENEYEKAQRQPALRTWPQTTSADVLLQEQPEARTWPPEASANTLVQEQSVARTWPPTRSAATVQDYLNRSHL